MLINSRVEIEIEELERKIKGFHSDYYYLLEEVDTELYKELDSTGRRLVFCVGCLDELGQVEDDLMKIVLHIENVIEEDEEKRVPQLSTMEQNAELHMYYASETI